MRLLIDENVHIGVGAVFAAAGHDVTNVRDLLTLSTPDDVIADIADDENLIVVTHDRDFRRLIPQIPWGERRRFRETTGRISLSGVREPDAVRRVASLMPEIEFTYGRALIKGQRLIMSISTTTYSVVSE